MKCVEVQSGLYTQRMKLYTPTTEKRRSPQKNRASRAFKSESRKELEKMIYLTDEIAMTADSMQYIVGKPVQRPGKGVKMQNPKYYRKLSAALQQAVADCIRAGVADGRITELRQITAEQARLEQEFSEKLKGVYV